MATEKNGKKTTMDMKCKECNGAHCHHCDHGGWHFILRVVLGIIIIVFVFWGGFQLGLVIGSSSYGYGYTPMGYYGMNRMMRGYWNGYDGSYGPGMMGGYYYPTATTTK